MAMTSTAVRVRRRLMCDVGKVPLRKGLREVLLNFLFPLEKQKR